MQKNQRITQITNIIRASTDTAIIISRELPSEVSLTFSPGFSRCVAKKEIKMITQYFFLYLGIVDVFQGNEGGLHMGTEGNQLHLGFFHTLIGFTQGCVWSKEKRLTPGPDVRRPYIFIW